MNNLIQQIQLADKYSRLKSDGTKETWPEVTTRVISFLQGQMLKQNKADKIPSQWWEDIREAMLNMDVLPSMRVVQMAGPALERDNVGAYNCAFLALDSPDALGELLYIMMQGTGVGFSVEHHHIDKWPAVTDIHANRLPAHITIQDSTEGWVNAYTTAIHTWMRGQEIEINYSFIRPAGSVLRTKGGYASGPDPLRFLLAKTRAIILGAVGRALRPFEVHRLATLAGSVVVVGGVRRAAQISLSDAFDDEMRNAKSGEFWHQFPELSMANNSAVVQSEHELEREWNTLRASGSGERGVFNPRGPIPTRRQREEFGTNPCGEILLRSKQFCNLSIAVARPDDNIDDLNYKVRLATLIGTIQSCLTFFPNLSPEWQENCEEERLLGVDITGTMDCKILQATTPETAQLLTHLQLNAIEWNKEFAHALEIRPSASITCNKPSGNSSQLLDCSSGIHPRYSRYYIRRLRIGRDTPLAGHLRSMGIPVHPEVGQETLLSSPTWVFELPAKSPDGAVVRADLTAIQQLDYWKMWKTCWTEHNPSCTIYIGENEWDQVYDWVRSNWDLIGGLSFLPRDNHIYQLAPYEEITEDEFTKRSEEITWDGEVLSAWAGEQAGSTDAACAGDFCEF